MSAISAWFRRALIPYRGGARGTARTCKGRFSAYTQGPRDLGLPKEDIRVLNKIIPVFCVDLQGPGDAFKDMELTIHGPVHSDANGAAMPMDEDDQGSLFFLNTPKGRATSPPRRAQLLLPLFKSSRAGFCAIWGCISSSSSSNRSGCQRRAKFS